MSAQPDLTLGETAVCPVCGRPYWAGQQPPCGCVPPEPAVCAADLPEGTPHPDPRLAARGWVVVRGIWRRAEGSSGEDVAA
jgi:hypothetical protein